MTSTSIDLEAPASVSVVHGRRVIFASSIGNALEWYDFLVYGFFAPIIAAQFFPNSDERVSLLFAVGSFGISFLARPVGAIVFGRYADRVGRRPALTLSILLMAMGTATIAVMPPYAEIGIVAPALIIFARLAQGLAVGGEFGSATAFMVEHGSARRGFYASWQFATQGLATIASAGASTVVALWLTTQELESWGWRIPLLLGILIVPVGFYIRRYIPESPEFVRSQREKGETPAATVSSQWLQILLAIGVVAQSTASVYAMQLYIPTYAAKELGLPIAQSFGVVIIGGGLQLLLAPVFGALSDRIGRIKIMLATTVALAVLVYPAFYLLNQNRSIGSLVALLVFAGFVKASYSGPMPALMSELFPVQTRSTALSLSYNIGVTLFGGFAPFIITWIIGVTGDKLAPSYYVLCAATISAVSLLVLAMQARRKSGTPLRKGEKS
ncbi:MFS transporter [Bradyrhizobium tropiciagri]|uniref:MFS transporter n=1 Tax=Bradyrhizobium tropiciagri TaxID=312253 RepID=UPI001BA46C87|nr:MFS transporter [Bradyrhizobium tropiciagri]MBR0898982.1 MFS transporter [Bradyrhizobium tropiciagri]